MSLLSRLAIGKSGDSKEQATKLINRADKQKHNDFNDKLAMEIDAKQMAYDMKSLEEMMRYS